VKKVLMCLLVFITAIVYVTASAVYGYTEIEYIGDEEELIDTGEILLNELERQIELENNENQIVFDEFLIRSLEINFNTTTDELNYDYTISEVKRLEDFAGNPYILLEFYPSGYAVYTNDLSIRLIRNFAATSPWYGFTEGLIFGGAAQYFIKPAVQPRMGALFIHTVVDRDLRVTPNELEVLVEHSDEMNDRIAESRLEERVASRWTTNNGFQAVEVSNRHILLTADTVDSNGRDFNQNGNCGYVAAALLVYFARGQRSWWDFAPQGLTNNLVHQIQGNRNNGSTASDVAGALRGYFNSIGSRARVESWYSPLANPMSIFDRIRDNWAVGLFGMLPHEGIKPPGSIITVIAHAVVVHRATREYSRDWLGIRTYRNYNFRVHYGWGERHNDIEINASATPIGSKVFIPW